MNVQKLWNFPQNFVKSHKVGKPEGKKHLEELDIEGRIILKRMQVLDKYILGLSSEIV